MDWATQPEVREGLYAAIQLANFIGDDTGCGGLDRIGFSRSHWWFKSIYKIIRPLTLTQLNNTNPTPPPHLGSDTHVRCQLAVGWYWLPTDDLLS